MDQLLTTPPLPLEVDPLGTALSAVLLATVFGIVVACLHLLATRGRDRVELWRTLILIAPLIAMATVAVGTNLAAAFTLFGTLAIVRFRTRIRNPLDAVFVIFSVVIGLATGNQNYMVAFVGTVIVGLTILILTSSSSKKCRSDGKLRVTLSPIDTKNDSWKAVLQELQISNRLLSTEIDRIAGTRTILLSTTNLEPETSQTLISRLQEIPEIIRASHKINQD